MYSKYCINLLAQNQEELHYILYNTVGQKTVPMFGYFAKIEVEQIKKIR